MTSTLAPPNCNGPRTIEKGENTPATRRGRSARKRSTKQKESNAATTTTGTATAPAAAPATSTTSIVTVGADMPASTATSVSVAPEDTKRPRSQGDLRGATSSLGTVVLKVGSSSLSAGDGTLALVVIGGLVEAIIELRKKGYNVILVTSGAVSVGCQRMALKERPQDLITKQAIAAIGQSRLMRLYDDFFTHKNQPIAQVLLSRENLSKAHHYLNALNTFTRLLELGVVPIVNDNDTVAVEELRVGDNDTLSALVASLVQADYLFLLTDVSALYTADPFKDPTATRISVVSNLDDLKVHIGGMGTWGTGGMGTKIQAAKIATAAGVRTVITKSTNPERIAKIMEEGDRCEWGTQFLSQAKPLAGRKRWIAHGYVPSGKLTLDAAAVRAVFSKKSLFGPGILKVEGDFHSHDNVSLCDESGWEFARGLVNYNADELKLIRGKPSSEFEAVLRYAGTEEIIEQNNLALLTDAGCSVVPASTAVTVPCTALSL